MKLTVLLRSVSTGAVLIFLCFGPSALRAEELESRDHAVEACLINGEVVEEVEVAIGITKPKRLVIECEGERAQAIFKHVDEVKRGRTRFGSGRSEINFTDSYRYERAAYLLDRALGIHRVPVAVVREVNGQDGALVQWIENASMEMELGRTLTTHELIDLAKQKGTMHVFDALILNTDRRPENWLLANADLSLFLIDHSRAFRLQHELPEDFVRRPARVSQQLLEELQDLNELGLTNLLEGLIDQAQIQAILARRDLIVQKALQDRDTYGESVVSSE